MMKLIEDDIDEPSDGELFVKMASKNEESENAFNIFYNRYKNDFYKNIFRLRLNEADRKELFNETMMQTYVKSHTFKVEKDISIKKQRGKTLSWLGKIARNIFNQKSRDKKKKINAEANEDLLETASENGIILKSQLSSKIRESENDFLGIENSESNKISLEKEILRKVLTELPERDRDILLSYYDEFDLEIKHQQLSGAKIKELTERYNVTPNYMRKIKERAFKTVRERCLNQKAKIVESKL